MTDNTRGTLEMTAAMVISGTIGWLVVLSGRPVTEVVFWRCLFGALTLLPVCMAMGFVRRGQATRRQLMLAALGGVAIVCNWLLLFAAYSRASISIATAVYNTQPFMLVGLGVLFLQERLTRAKLGWLLLSFVGVLLIVQAQPDADTGGGDYLLGIGMALGAAFFYALAALITKMLKGVPAHLIALVQVCVGTVLLLPMALHSSEAMAPSSWALLVTLGIVHTGFMYILLYSAIQRLPTPMTGTLSFIYPVVAFLVDAFAFGHRLHPIQMVGAAAILLAAAGMMLGLKWRPRHLIEQ
ncbi:DMT family transporter [Castellaniella hirudinis]|uniref:DMT family transporter n=1 Tax=Castellaniella hirudinis TaxID=1144617 RepID=A0ABV8RY38_9BURK